MKWANRLVWNKVSKIAILTCLSASVAFAGFTIYGSKVGNFVVNVEDTIGYLKLTIDEDPFAEDASYTTRLSTPALTKQIDATYSDIPSNISSGMGSKNDENYRYFAYSFYLVNGDDESADYEFSVIINETTGGADDIVRFMVIKGDSYTNGVDITYPADTAKSQGVIYAKEETSVENKEYVQTNAGYQQVDFVSDTVVCETTDALAADSCVKYTVVMWIEGWDAECTDERIGGTIKMQIDITQIGLE